MNRRTFVTKYRNDLKTVTVIITKTHKRVGMDERKINKKGYPEVIMLSIEKQ